MNRERLSDFEIGPLALGFATMKRP